MSIVIVRQAAIIGTVAMMLGGCGWLTPPCERVSRAVCPIGREGDACSFLLTRGGDNKDAQAVCKEILPAAKALAADPRSPEAKEEWNKARQQLIGMGMNADPNHGEIGNKLIRVGGLPGKIVQDLRDNTKAAEDNTNEAAQRALDGAK